MPVLGPHRRVALDSNVLIYLLESAGPLAETAAALVDAIESGEYEGVLSAVGLMEVLVGPARLGDAQAFELTADAIRDLRVRVVPVDGETAEDAAWIRGILGIGVEDAVHLASARNAGATAFVTNDRRIRSIPKMAVVYLEEIAV
jgi:predicted nucleic acid-binding protein